MACTRDQIHRARLSTPAGFAGHVLGLRLPKLQGAPDAAATQFPSAWLHFETNPRQVQAGWAPLQPVWPMEQVSAAPAPPQLAEHVPAPPRHAGWQAVKA